MGRTYLADKETLDNVNTNIGATGDTNGTTVTGSIFGKLNVLLSLWTSARAAKVDSTSADASSAKTSASQAATNTATSNTANANGTLSQKLTYIIQQVTSLDSRISNLETNAGGEQRILVRMPATDVLVPHTGGVWQEVVKINGAGILHSLYNDSPSYYTSGTRVTIDGTTVIELGPSGNANWLAQTRDGIIKYVDEEDLAKSVPIRFKSDFKIEILPANAYGTDHKVRAFYELYKNGIFISEV